MTFNLDELFLLKNNLKKMMDELIGMEFFEHRKGEYEESDYVSGFVKIVSVDKNTLDVLYLKSNGRCGGYEFTPTYSLGKYFITFETFEDNIKRMKYINQTKGKFEEEFNECWKDYHIIMKEKK